MWCHPQCKTRHSVTIINTIQLIASVLILLIHLFVFYDFFNSLNCSFSLQLVKSSEIAHALWQVHLTRYILHNIPSFHRSAIPPFLILESVELKCHCMHYVQKARDNEYVVTSPFGPVSYEAQHARKKEIPSPWLPPPCSINVYCLFSPYIGVRR